MDPRLMLPSQVQAGTHSLDHFAIDRFRWGPVRRQMRVVTPTCFMCLGDALAKLRNCSSSCF